MKFYWCEKSRAFRIAWMMEELGLPYERIRVDIRDNDAERDAEFLAASPLGKVPALIDGKTKLWDSGAICLHLADTYPVAGLGVASGDPRRGAFLQWIMFTNAVIEPAMVEKFADLEVQPLRYGHGSFDQMIETLENGISAGPWIMGDRFTAADVLLGSSTHFLETFGVLPGASPLKAYAERCRARPAFQAAQSFDADS